MSGLKLNEQMVEEIMQLSPEKNAELAEKNLADFRATLPENFEDAKPVVNEKPSYKPEDLAATFFAMQAPKLDNLLNNMSAKQMRRVLFNAVSYPLVDRKYHPRTQEEKDVAYLVGEMVLNRTIMQLSFEMAKADEDMKKQATNEEQDVNMNTESMVKPVMNELVEKQMEKDNKNG